jgi:NADPH:quinone reductase-like Zn-dependent oxidoreductase
MKAIICEHYGGPESLRLAEVNKPVPGEDEVVVKVVAAAVNPQDWHMMTGLPYFMRASNGVRAPKEPALGTDFAGVVDSVGAAVTKFRVGDEVFGVRTGAFAEYVRVRETGALVPKPANVSFEEAASIPVAGLTALQGLRAGGIAAGRRVLIIGAAGGVGTYAIQIAKALGAEVTGVCSTGKLDLIRSIGADHAIDYTRQDFARLPDRYDLILDNVGTRSIADRKRVLARGGTLVSVSGPKTNRLLGPVTSVVRLVLTAKLTRARLRWVLAKVDRDDLAALGDMLASGQVRSVVGGTFALSDTPDAVRQVGTGHTAGKLVVRM